MAYKARAKARARMSRRKATHLMLSLHRKRMSRCFRLRLRMGRGGMQQLKPINVAHASMRIAMSTVCGHARLAWQRSAARCMTPCIRSSNGSPDRGAMWPAGPEKVSLQDALSLFENEWTEKLDQERRLQGNEDEGNTADATDATAVAELEAPSAVPGDAFLEVYRRHGRHVIERAWAGMVQQQLPGIDAEGLIFDAEETSFDEQVTLRVGERELSVLLDRVERGEAAATPPPANGHAGPTGATSTTSTANSAIKPNGKRQATAVPSTPASQPAPVRIVRHRLGRSSAGKPDLHALFYALAAQQSGAATAEFYSHNLTTGELERVTLDERKLAKLREELDTLLDGIESGFYPPKPDPATCQNCPFLLICPA